MAEQLDRFRSFVERYVIARAGHFEVGREQEQAWMAIQDAKKVYGMVADAKNETDPEPTQAGIAGVAQAPAGLNPGPGIIMGPPPGHIVYNPGRNAAKVISPAPKASGWRQLIGRSR